MLPGSTKRDENSDTLSIAWTKPEFKLCEYSSVEIDGFLAAEQLDEAVQAISKHFGAVQES